MEGRRMGYFFFVIIYTLVHVLTNIESVRCGTPPSIVTHPQGGAFRYEDSVTLECKAEGDPAVEYAWTQNEAVLDTDVPNIEFTGDGGSIILKNLSEINEGSFQCTAQNVYGKALSDIAVLRRAFLEFESSSPRQYGFSKGDSLVIRCHWYNSYPEADITWARSASGDGWDMEPVVESNRIHMDWHGGLYFSNLEMEDAAEDVRYYCLAHNSFLREMRSGEEVILTVDDTDEITPREPSIMVMVSIWTGVRSQSVTMYCIFGGYPTPEHTWRRKNGSLPVGRSEIRSGGTTLYIDNLSHEDEGIYICGANNTEGQVSYEIELHIKSPPVFLTKEENNGTEAQPINQNKTVGESVTFLCKTEADPSATVRWTINGEPLTQQRQSLMSRLRLTDNDRSLTIVDLCKDCPDGSADMMVVQCNASNRFGYAYAQGYINLFVSSLDIAVEPSDVMLTSWNEKAVFRCAVTIDPEQSFNITWIHNDVEIATGQPYSVDGPYLLVDTVAGGFIEALEGQYTCVACIRSLCKSATATLSFEELRKSIAVSIRHKESCHRFHGEGDNALIVCEVQGVNEYAGEMQIKWYSATDDEITASTGRVYAERKLNSLHPYSALYIKDIEEENAGRYRCEATLRGVKTEDSVEIEIHQDIQFGDILSAYYSKIGYNASLVCSVEGSPMPEIEWRLNKTIVATGAVLNLTNVSETDSGVYECRASEPRTGRFDNHFVHFQVQEMHFPLEAVIFHQIDRDHVLFDPVPHPDGIRFTTYYVVRSCAHHDCGARFLNSEEFPQVLEMDPATTYWFTIQARNGTQAFDRSAVFKFTTA